MAGLIRKGKDANVFGSKFKATEGGLDAGNGKRTYTTPSYTLFVTHIPDAEGSAAVERVFENDRGFLQCRPVGHKQRRRMVFVDYDSIEAATRGMRLHQGRKFAPEDEGLRIDFDKDARQKRNIALDQGRFEKFFPIGVRKAYVESEEAVFARERSEALEASRLAAVGAAVGAAGAGAARSGGGSGEAVAKAKAKSRAKPKARRTAVGAKLRVRKVGEEAGATSAEQPDAVDAAASKPLQGLLGGYGSEGSSSEYDEEEEEEEEVQSDADCEEDEDEEEEEEDEYASDGLVDVSAPAGAAETAAASLAEPASKRFRADGVG
eukprot:TRINITY_DN3339_c1_g3_i2.p1 TRINITY_DN3339_c1_g3~~TRINITY_DN3339_c1_g3_i2.p1  ORF type:complete len:321 (-),score=98.44 TRINITY_DN3339_c1_g3_i2:18-980(-)